MYKCYELQKKCITHSLDNFLFHRHNIHAEQADTEEKKNADTKTILFCAGVLASYS